ncbi:MAG: type II toxin-antitoxin system PemK/MazF family toxin [Candidatus Woesearchaeota archaeon]|jgi:mRNA interferase MazF|nr:type II toxin-antitoxin system PemK/MazF family toxin [Candidatus Woesearchaeota archaeon]
MSIEIRRGEIVLVNLDPVIGSEQGKTRPVLVIQNDVGNEFSPTIIIASITSRVFEKEYLTNVFLSLKISELDKDSTVLLNQIRTIDKKRIIKKLGSLNVNYMKKVDRALIKSLAIDV